MLRIEMLPATCGDCLWIEYGEGKGLHRILIDGGTAGSVKPLVAKIKELPEGEREFELLVVTHVDGDHIAGVLKLLETPKLGVRINEIWFNAYRHLIEAGEGFGPVQGERLSDGVVAGKVGWNAKFNEHAVAVPDRGALPVKKLPGGLELVVLGPTREKLRLLKPVWIEACKEAHIKPGKARRVPVPPGLEVFGPPNVDVLAATAFEEDAAAANGSSIVLLLRYKGTSVLLGADGHPTVIAAGLKRYANGDARVKLDAYKVAHHGSHHNMSKDLLDLIDCRTYLFSSNGSRFKHPSPDAVARAVKYGSNGKDPTRLVFNYRTQFNDIWDAPSLKRKWRYETIFPADSEDGIVAFQA